MDAERICRLPDYYRTFVFLHYKCSALSIFKAGQCQSTTIFGGMENAGNIFYAENLVTVISVRKKSLPMKLHINGLATRLQRECTMSGSAKDLQHISPILLWNKYGRDVFKSRMESDRKVVIRYASRNFAPVIDTTITIIWIFWIKFLRERRLVFAYAEKELGDDLFWNCIRAFYEKFKYSNALTGILRSSLNRLRERYGYIFEQWLYKAGIRNKYFLVSEKRTSWFKLNSCKKVQSLIFPWNWICQERWFHKNRVVHMKKVLETFSFPWNHY